MGDGAAERVVVVFPADAFEDGVCVWEGRELEFGGLCSLMVCQSCLCFYSELVVENRTYWRELVLGH